METFGPTDHVQTKQRLIASLINGADAGSFEVPDDRFHRLVVRVTLRQFAHISKLMESRELSALVQRWRRRFDDVVDASIDDGIAEHH